MVLGLCAIAATVIGGGVWLVLPNPMFVVVAAAAVLAIGALYEIFEWLLTIGMNAEAADQYNGQQGDMWDAHADMLMATLGSLLIWPLIRRSAQQ